MNNNDESKIWFSSKEVTSKLKIKGCDLMHYRVAGKLKFIKKGNTFFYDKKSIENLNKTKQG